MKGTLEQPLIVIGVIGTTATRAMAFVYKEMPSDACSAVQAGATARQTWK